MAPTILYTVCVLGTLGLYLAVRPGVSHVRRTQVMRLIGAVLGLGAFTFLIGEMAEAVGASERLPEAFFMIFSLIAIVCAVKMITSSRPVYSALYFVLVVLSSAALFLLLEAEFLAFALIIVYAGAILITYMFVLMLAQQSPDPDQPEAQPEYDLNPREPQEGVIVGLILLCLLTRMLFDGVGTLEPRVSPRVASVERWTELHQMPARIEAFAEEPLALAPTGRARLEIAPDGSGAAVYVLPDGAGEPVARVLPEEARPENVQSVGLALVGKFPVSLELAGIILLMAMFGAVILAHRQIELTEDEKREAGGLRRFGHHDDDTASDGGAPS